uniref:BRMS1 like transcriptional repressor b n=1 Tax=Oncorhynchus mykiss TaxID=8022 RepID=A0A8C7VH36_ONCMY
KCKLAKRKKATTKNMEVDFPEQDASSTDEEDIVSSSVSEDGDSSEMNDEDCERRRVECMDEMTTLEKQFGDLKEQLYKERLCQVDIKLQEVIAACAQEYLEPLANLQENMQIRTKVGGIYQELCLESVKNKYDCEIQAACQHWESEKLLLFDTVHSDLEEKIRRLEEDRHSIDITSGTGGYSPGLYKRPVLISIKNLNLDVLEDWTAIRKAEVTLGSHRVKVDGKNLRFMSFICYSIWSHIILRAGMKCRGQALCINKKDQHTTRCVSWCLCRKCMFSNGVCVFLYLQEGKYTIKHS